MRNYVDFWVARVVWSYGDQSNPSTGSFYALAAESEDLDAEIERKLRQLFSVTPDGFYFNVEYREKRWIILNHAVILHLMWVLDGWEYTLQNADPSTLDFPTYIVKESPRKKGGGQVHTDFEFIPG